MILDENVTKQGVAAALRAKGYNVRDVVEIFGRTGVKDKDIIDLANRIGGRVITNNVKDFGRPLSIPIPTPGGKTADQLQQFIDYYTK